MTLSHSHRLQHRSDITVTSGVVDSVRTASGSVANIRHSSIQIPAILFRVFTAYNDIVGLSAFDEDRRNFDSAAHIIFETFLSQFHIDQLCIFFDFCAYNNHNNFLPICFFIYSYDRWHVFTHNTAEYKSVISASNKI